MPFRSRSQSSSWEPAGSFSPSDRVYHICHISRCQDLERTFVLLTGRHTAAHHRQEVLAKPRVGPIVMTALLGLEGHVGCAARGHGFGSVRAVREDPPVPQR